MGTNPSPNAATMGQGLGMGSWEWCSAANAMRVLRIGSGRKPAAMMPGNGVARKRFPDRTPATAGPQRTRRSVTAVGAVRSDAWMTAMLENGLQFGTSSHERSIA